MAAATTYTRQPVVFVQITGMTREGWRQLSRELHKRGIYRAHTRQQAYALARAGHPLISCIQNEADEAVISEVSSYYDCDGQLCLTCENCDPVYLPMPRLHVREGGWGARAYMVDIGQIVEWIARQVL